MPIVDYGWKLHCVTVTQDWMTQPPTVRARRRVARDRADEAALATVLHDLPLHSTRKQHLHVVALLPSVHPVDGLPHDTQVGPGFGAPCSRASEWAFSIFHVSLRI
ncbi:hypothetical protein PF002_g3275 [Phytophthora fragariae]|uniref:Uncharacterized protein n=1 Tax=Phytophthora fragariae TaxID=53985 RepID=A0A6A4A7J8_9STRA|nr:hypothetical protein PF002_g3275 [Phytophthora fragariae]